MSDTPQDSQERRKLADFLKYGTLIDGSVNPNTLNTLQRYIDTYVAEQVKAANLRTLETTAMLLNGDANQVDVVKGYVVNKLKMYRENPELLTPTNKERIICTTNQFNTES